ncbi:MAG TPA: endolytic transglycosylase MltG [Thermomicrobiales bacterium]|nr:endolytic transglycosylase MltG [Thermomicrobiales bacterium]
MSPKTRQIIAVSSIVLIAFAVAFIVQQIITDHLNSARDEVGRPVEFVIEPSESLDSIGERLEEAGLIRSVTYFRLRVQFSGQDDDIVAGTHQLNTAMTTSQIIDTITSQENISVPETTVTFLEGWRIEQYAEELVDAGLIEEPEEFIEAANDPSWNDEFGFLHSRPSGANLEGYLFPDTYRFRQDATPHDIIRTLLATFDERVNAELRASAEGLGMTIHQAMTLASIVEREAAVPSERPLIAAVYYNRYLIGMPLQADPTIQYVLGQPGDWWPVIEGVDLDVASPYNTYSSPGFPPGPICNPGLDSLRAAFSPPETNDLFFVARGDGTHAFAETAEEHQQNVERYQSDEQ